MNELELAVYVRVAHCINLFNKFSEKAYEEKVKVKFDLKGHTAGQAFYNTNKIRLNIDLMIKYRQIFINETVDHEMAHLFAHHLRPHCQAHGYTWRLCMDWLGYPEAERCHSMKTTSARKTKKFAHYCDCVDPHLVGAIKHKKIEAGIGYICRECKARLQKERK